MAWSPSSKVTALFPCLFLSRAHRTILVSVAESSTTKISFGRERTNSSMALPLDPGRGKAQPKVLDHSDRVLEVVQVEGFGDIAVRPQRVAAVHVALRFGRGEDHDGDAFQLRIGLALCQDLPAVLFGQVQVQNDQVGPGARRPA